MDLVRGGLKVTDPNPGLTPNPNPNPSQVRVPYGLWLTLTLTRTLTRTVALTLTRAAASVAVGAAWDFLRAAAALPPREALAAASAPMEGARDGPSAALG